MIDLERQCQRCVISDQFGLQAILEGLAWFIKKVQQLKQSDAPALTLMLSVKGPLLHFLIKS